MAGQMDVECAIAACAEPAVNTVRKTSGATGEARLVFLCRSHTSKYLVLGPGPTS